MKLELIKKGATQVFWKGQTFLKKNSPEILLGLGLVSIVGGTVMACKATLELNDVMQTAFDRKESIKEIKKDHPVAYTQQEYNRDITVSYIKTGVDLAKLYGPAVAVGAFGVACVFSSHDIMRQRNVAIAAAYNVLDKGFKEYRSRVVEELGEDKDKQFRYGYKKTEITEIETDENGKEKKVKKKVNVVPGGESIYARFFDETSIHWTKTPEYNLIFLKAQQNYANNLLQSRGHVFLNEVYDSLGIERSQAGAVVGWVLGEGDNYIDFGIFDVYNESSREFVNGFERSVLLDFNVDGYIVDKI